jgi:hypothetical protein
MAEGYVDENGRIRWAEQHDLEELAAPPRREPDDDEDGDEEGEGDDD